MIKIKSLVPQAKYVSEISDGSFFIYLEDPNVKLEDLYISYVSFKVNDNKIFCLTPNDIIEESSNCYTDSQIFYEVEIESINIKLV